MIVTAIYGTEHVGSTVHLSRMAIETLQPDEVHEFFLPRDFHHMCTGCNACFFCTSCLLRACARSNGTHSGYHRPSRCAHPCISCLRLSRHRRNEILFGSLWLPLDAAPSQPIHVHQTSASADNSRRRRNAPHLAGFAGQHEFLGCGRVVRLGRAIHALTWDAVSPAMRSRLERDVQKACRRLRFDRPVKPRLYVCLMFGFFRRLLPRMNTATDLQYWETQGWFSGHKPW